MIVRAWIFSIQKIKMNNPIERFHFLTLSLSIFTTHFSTCFFPSLLFQSICSPKTFKFRCSYQPITFMHNDYYNLWLWHALFIFVYKFNESPNRSVHFEPFRRDFECKCANEWTDQVKKKIYLYSRLFKCRIRGLQFPRNRHSNSKINGFNIRLIHSLTPPRTHT